MSSSNQKIGVGTATIFNLNAMVGAGIFATTPLLAAHVGAAGMVTFALTFLAVWFIAQSFARIAFLCPEEGSFYAYAKRWGGHKLGLFAAGAYQIGILIAMGLLCKIAGMYLAKFFPTIAPLYLGLLSLGALVAFNLCGMVLTKVAQYVLLAFTVIPLAFTTIMCFTKMNLANLTPFMPHGTTSVLQNSTIAIFGLFGFECIASLFSVVENPEKNVSKALRYSLLLVGLIYFTFIASVLLAVPHEFFTANTTIAQVLIHLFPEYGFLLDLVDITIVFAILGTVHSVIWASSELMLAYFRRMRIPALQHALLYNQINKKTTVFLCGAIILASGLMISNLDVFFNITNIFILVAYCTAIAALLFEKNEWKSGQNITTLLGLTTALVILGLAVQTLVKHIF